MRIHMDDFLSDIKNQKELFWENTSVLKYNEVEKQIDPSLIPVSYTHLLPGRMLQQDAEFFGKAA